MKNLYLIACVSQDVGLGQSGKLLWSIPEDMRFFRQTTTGSTVVMGRKTFESIGRPLPQRENIILSRQALIDTADSNLKVYHDKTSLDQYLNSLDGPKFIIGGASLYQMYLDAATKIYLTEVQATRPADVYFPEFDKSLFLRKVLKTGQQDNINYEIVEYTRKS